MDVPKDAAANTEETFGPTLTVTKVRDADEAIELSNATGYGLAGAVFAKARGMEIARRMRTGMTSVNSVIAFATVPQLPFGGVGESASDGSTGRTACANSRGPRQSPGSGSHSRCP